MVLWEFTRPKLLVVAVTAVTATVVQVRETNIVQYYVVTPFLSNNAFFVLGPGYAVCAGVYFQPRAAWGTVTFVRPSTLYLRISLPAFHDLKNLTIDHNISHTVMSLI